MKTAYIPQRPGEADTTLADIQFTTEKLGWIPQFVLEDYINDFLDEMDPLPEKEPWFSWFKRTLSS